ISPQGWDYVFLISTPAVMYLVNYRAELPRLLRAFVRAALLGRGFSIWDVIGRRAYSMLMRASVIPACYVIEIAGLAALRIRRVAEWSVAADNRHDEAAVLVAAKADFEMLVHLAGSLLN